MPRAHSFFFKKNWSNKLGSCKRRCPLHLYTLSTCWFPHTYATLWPKSIHNSSTKCFGGLCPFNSPISGWRRSAHSMSTSQYVWPYRKFYGVANSGEKSKWQSARETYDSDEEERRKEEKLKECSKWEMKSNSSSHNQCNECMWADCIFACLNGLAIEIHGLFTARERKKEKETKKAQF